MDDVTIEHAARVIQHALYTGTVYDDAAERHQAITRHPAGKRIPPQHQPATQTSRNDSASLDT